MKHLLYDLRHRRRLTQEEAATGCGVSLTTYNKWERCGLSKVTAENLLRIAEFFGVAAEELDLTDPRKEG